MIVRVLMLMENQIIFYSIGANVERAHAKNTPHKKNLPPLKIISGSGRWSACAMGK